MVIPTNEGVNKMTKEKHIKQLEKNIKAAQEDRDAFLKRYDKSGEKVYLLNVEHLNKRIIDMQNQLTEVLQA